MNLEMINVGIIKKANIHIDGLTVIAGENDSGKSTVGKVLYSLIKADNMAKRKEQRHSSDKRDYTLKQVLSLVFDQTLFPRGTVQLWSDNKPAYEARFSKGSSIFNTTHSPFADATIIESPLIWNMTDFFSTVEKLRTEDEMFGIGFDIKYPYVSWDLYKKLSVERNYGALQNGPDVLNQIYSTINGKFEKSGGKYVFIKQENGKKISVPIFNTASGIRSLGILQILLENCQIHSRTLLIVDEPEVHLHPMWEVIYAQVLCEFVKSGVSVVVNTHSIYMVQALKKYSASFADRTHFYLTEKENERSTFIDVSHNLNQIFKKFNDPLQRLIWEE